MKKPQKASVVALVAMIVIWGYSWPMMKIGLRHAHPFDFAALRVGIGALVLFAIVIVRGRGLALTRYRMAFVVGSLQVALFVALTQFALLYGDTGRTSVLVFTMPFWMIVFAHYLLDERMRGTQWLAVALAFAGLVLIVAPWRLTSLEASALAIAGGAVWAISAVLSKKWPTEGADPLLFTAWQLLFGFLWLLALAWATRTRASSGRRSSSWRSSSARCSRRDSAGGSGPTCSRTRPRESRASTRSAFR